MFCTAKAAFQLKPFRHVSCFDPPAVILAALQVCKKVFIALALLDAGKMRRFPVLVSLVAVGFGLVALYSHYYNQDVHVGADSWNLGSSASLSHAQAAGTTKLQLWPLDRIDVALFLVIAVCLSLAGGAGIGGGAVLVPVFIMLRGGHSDSLLTTIRNVYASKPRLCCKLCRQSIRTGGSGSFSRGQHVSCSEPCLPDSAGWQACVSRVLSQQRHTTDTLACISAISLSDLILVGVRTRRMAHLNGCGHVQRHCPGEQCHNISLSQYSCFTAAAGVPTWVCLRSSPTSGKNSAFRAPSPFPYTTVCTGRPSAPHLAGNVHWQLLQVMHL